MTNSPNDWYIDRASNIYVEGFNEIVSFLQLNVRTKFTVRN